MQMGRKVVGSQNTLSHLHDICRADSAKKLCVLMMHAHLFDVYKFLSQKVFAAAIFCKISSRRGALCVQKGTRDSDVLIKRCYSFSEYAIFAEQKRSQESPTADNWQNVFSPHSQ
jgi:hypothetical protein